MTDDRLAAAETQRMLLIRWLIAHGSPQALELAGGLKNCRTSQPCRSPACQVCGLAFQALSYKIVEGYLDPLSRGMRKRMHAIAIVPAEGCIRLGALSVEAFRRVEVLVREALRDLDFPPSIVSIEASFNEDATGRNPPHWSVHVHLLGVGWLSKDQVDELRRRFPVHRLAARPVMYEELDSDPRGKLYPFKAERVRRVTELVEDHPTRQPFRGSRRRALRQSQAVELAIVEHRLGFAGRLICHGIDEVSIKTRLSAEGWARDGP